MKQSSFGIIGCTLLASIGVTCLTQPSVAQVSADIAFADARACPSLDFTPPPFRMPDRGAAETDTGYDARVAAEFAKFNIRQPCVFNTETGMQIRLFEPVTNGESPTAKDFVQLRYESRRVNGDVLKSNLADEQPALFDMSVAVPAWQEALPHMRIGERWVLYAPPALTVSDKQTDEPTQGMIYEIQLLGLAQGDPSNESRN